MTHSPLATRTVWTTDRSPRGKGRVDCFLLHHAATVSLPLILQLFQPGGRQVSANYALKDRDVVATVPEEYAAWTSGSQAWDRRAITVEVANSQAGGVWPVSDESFDTLARLIADVATRYGFPINDDTILTHQELYTRFRASYATACPGDMQRRKGELIRLARYYAAFGGRLKETRVIPTFRADATAEETGRVLNPGEGFYLHTTAGVPWWNASDVTGETGPYSITTHVYADGVPGDVVEHKLIWQATKATPVTNSPHYVERVEIDRDGLVRATREFKRAARAGDAVHLWVEAPKTNKAPVTVTLARTDAYRFVTA